MAAPRKKPSSPPSDVELPANGWKPRPYQVGFWQYMLNKTWGARAILCHHRRAGKDHTAINWCAVASQLRVGLYIHVFPYANQGRRIVWDGIDFAGNKFLDAFPKELIARKMDLEMKLYLTNGSIYQVLGADDPDKLVGINCVGAIFSEYALMDPKALNLVMPILNENGGWAVFPTTPRGKNHFYDLFTNAKKDPKWYVSHETIETTGAVDPIVIEQERSRGVDEPLIQQEYFCSFDAGLSGAYYEKQLAMLEKQGRIVNFQHEPALEVHTAWDLGINDTTAIWFFQEARDGVRILDHLEAKDLALPWYVQQVRQKAMDNTWVYGRHYGPHDVMQRDLSTGNTLYTTAASLGLRWTVVPKIDDLRHGIEATRQCLAQCWFNKKTTGKGVEALKSYRKQWDEKNKCYRDRPLHDWSSNTADAMRTLAMGRRALDPNRKKPTLQTSTLADYDPLAR
jgi:phage terminase large subunit